MKVHIVTQEPYHDNSTILGVFGSLHEAMRFAVRHIETTIKQDRERVRYYTGFDSSGDDVRITTAIIGKGVRHAVEWSGSKWVNPLRDFVLVSDDLYYYLKYLKKERQ